MPINGTLEIVGAVGSISHKKTSVGRRAGNDLIHGADERVEQLRCRGKGAVKENRNEPGNCFNARSRSISSVDGDGRGSR